MKLNIDKIRIDGGTQSRVSIDDKIVQEYAEAMKEGNKFPPIIVFYDEHDYWLADGFQRYKACLINNYDKINSKIIKGSKRDAILYSVGANATHGKRRRNEDKRKAVITLLEDEEWREWSDAIIAEKCFVSVTLVYTIRSENPTYFSNTLMAKGADGKTRKKKQNKKPKLEIVKETIEETENDSNEENEDENNFESQEETIDEENQEDNSEQKDEETENENVDNEENKQKHKKKKTDYHLRKEAAYNMITTFLESLPEKIQNREKEAMIEWLINYPKELN